MTNIVLSMRLNRDNLRIVEEKSLYCTNVYYSSCLLQKERMFGKLRNEMILTELKSDKNTSKPLREILEKFRILS